MNEQVIRILITAHDHASKAFKQVEMAAKSMRDGFNGVDRDSSNMSRGMNRIGQSARQMSGHLDRAKVSLKEFGLSGAAVMALGPLSDMIVALSGQLLTLASSAGIAATTLGAGLAAGAAQAAPVIGLLIAGAKGVANVMGAVKAANQEQAKSSAGATEAAQKQADANDQLKSAQDRLADAQRGLTEARREARRELEDMIVQQERARIGTQKADLSVADAKRALRNATLSGDTAAMDEAQLNLQSAKLDRKESGTAQSRGGADLKRAMSAGVEGSDRVRAATKELEDATRSLSAAQKDAASSAMSQAGAASALATALAKLTPAQKRLFDAMMSLQTAAKRTMGRVQDSIIDGFTHAVKGAERVLRNADVQSAMGKLGDSMKKGIKQISDVFAGPEGQKIFAGLAEAASKNVPRLSNALADLLKAFGRLAIAGRPFVAWMVKGFEQWAHGVERASRNTKALDKFFVEGQKHLSAWIHLLGSIINLFGAISGSGGAASGLRTVDRMAKSINGVASDIRKNRKESEEFWKATEVGGSAVMQVLGAIGRGMIEVFSASGGKSLKAFADLISQILVPALVTVVKFTSFVVTALVRLMTLPIIKDLIKWGLAFAGIGFAMMKVWKLLGVGAALFRTLATAARFLFAIFAANPVVAAIAAIAIALVLLDKKFHFIKPAVQAVTNAFKDLGKWLATNVVPTLKKIGKAFGEFAEDIWNDGLKPAVQALEKAFVPAFKSIAKNVIPPLKQIIKALGDVATWIITGPIGQAIGFLIKLSIKLQVFIVTTYVKIAAFIISTLGKVASWIINGPIGDAIKWLIGAFVDMYEGIVDALGDAWRFIRRVVSRIANLFTDGPIGDALRWIAKAFRRAYNAITDTLGDIWSVVKKVGRRIGNAFVDVWDRIKDSAKAAFNWIKNRLKDFWEGFIDIVKGVSGAVNDAFEAVANGVKNVFVKIFKTIYNAVRDVINSIANGVSKVANLPGVKSITGGVEKDPMPPYDKAFATGGVIKAKPGGIVAKIGEAGYDEVVLTTDPKHRARTQNLLGMFMDKVGMGGDVTHFAKGGYVQGAAGNPPTQGAAQALAQLMFSKGFSVTSALRPGGKTYHGAGAALDFGDSVNSLGAVWQALWPMRRFFAELLGPKGLYNYGKQFKNAGLQAMHNDHVHVATPGLTPQKIGSLFGSALKGISNILGLGGGGGGGKGIAKWLIKATKNIGSWIEEQIGGDPKNKKGAGPLRGMLHGVWKAAKKVIAKQVKEAKESSGGGAEDMGTDVGGGLKGWLTRALKITNHYSAANLKALTGRAMQESGGNPRAVNNWDSNAAAGTPSKGLLQTIEPTFNSYKLPGMNNIFNPVHNAVAAIRYMFAKYKRIVGPSATGYAVGGEIPGQEGVPVGVLAHAGEMILNRKQQNALGGPNYLRSKFGFKGGRTGHFATGGVVGVPSTLKRSTAGQADALSDLSVDLDELLSATRKMKGNKWLKKLKGVINDLTSDEGPISKLLESLQTMRDKFDSYLKKRRFKETTRADVNEEDAAKVEETEAALKKEQRKKRPNKKKIKSLERTLSKLTSQNVVVERLDESDIAEAQLGELNEEGAQLRSARQGVGEDIGKLQKELKNTKGKGSGKRKEQLKSRIKGLQTKMGDLDAAIGDNLDARFQKQQELIDAQVNEAQTNADSRNASIDVRKRIATATGDVQAIPRLIDEQASSAQAQIGDLTKALNTAKQFGNQDAQKKIQQSITELEASIAELAIERINAQVNAINTEAERSTAGIDRAKRMATATGQRGQVAGLMGQQADVLRKQASDLRDQAWAARGYSPELRAQLDAQAAELDVQVAELVKARNEEIVGYGIENAQKAAARRDSSISLRRRIATSLGKLDQIPALIEEQISSASTQLSDLQAVLAAAQATGDQDLIDQVQTQVNDLTASITELATERLNAAIESVNSAASTQLGLIDVQSRIANISDLGRPDYAALGSLMESKGTVLTEQKAQLEALLSDAIAAGNEALTDSLTQSVADLDATIQENTLAIEQNTVAALQSRIDTSTKTSNFLTGVADASSGIIKTIGEMLGDVDTGALLEYAESKGATITQQGTDLKTYLDEFMGGALDDSFLTATGTDLVEMVNEIVSSTDLSGMIQEEIDQFYALIDAILANEQSLQDNTAAIEELEGTMNEQTFSTTAWDTFRQAIFDGSGNLLSAYDIPQMAEGGMVGKEGLFNLHPGERVLTAEETKNFNQGDLNINTTVNNYDGGTAPDLLAKQIAWELSSRGRV